MMHVDEKTRLAARQTNPSPYVELTRLVERMHRRFLDVLRDQLRRLEIGDINAVQCLLLCNIGDEEVNNRHLMERGYYQGSNASYNIKHLVGAGYLEQRQDPHDRRSTLLKLAPKGRDLAAKIAAGEVAIAGRLVATELEGATKTLRELERIWADVVSDRA